MGDTTKRTLKNRFNRGSSSSTYFTKGHDSAVERLPSFAHMVNIFLGSGTQAGSPRSSFMEEGRKKKGDVRIRKSSQALKRNHHK